MLFWELIPQLHEGLQKKFKELNACSKAQAYRQLAENPTAYFDEHLYYLFVGFNALSGAEQHIIKYLIDKKQAEFIIDSDTYYYDNKFHEAGHFQRKNNAFFISFTAFCHNHKASSIVLQCFYIRFNS